MPRRLNQVAEDADMQPQGRARRVDVADRAQQLPRQVRRWRTVKQLTEELEFSSPDACRVWLKRHGVASVRRGRIILVSPLDIDRVLRKV